MNCKNGCNAQRYAARLICKACINEENKARKRRKKVVGPNNADSVFYREYQSFSGDWLRRPIRVNL